MNLIINYIAKMFNHLLLFTCLYVTIRLIIIIRNKKINIKREILLYVFFLFLLGLYTVAITGDFSIKNISLSKINIIPFKIIKDTIYETFKLNNLSYFIISFLGNIFIFIPIGFLISLIWNIKDKKVILIGFLISLSIELTQIFLKRTTDIDDLILNTLGVIIGVLISKRIKNKR